MNGALGGPILGAFLGIWQGLCTLTPPYNGASQIPMRFTLAARTPASQAAPTAYDFTIEYGGMEPRRYLLKDASDQCPGCFDLDEQNGIVLREVLSPDGRFLRSVFSVDVDATCANLISSTWHALPAKRGQPSALSISLITQRMMRVMPIQPGPVVATQQCLLQKL